MKTKNISLRLSKETVDLVRARTEELKGVGPRVRYSISAYLEELIKKDIQDEILQKFEG
tara:strand:- start:873 stop:1049 length:177 start_codon:yes stop_codon:yes gene_type:complete